MSGAAASDVSRNLRYFVFIRKLKHMIENPFLTDVQHLRERVRQHLDEGAANAGDSVHRETVLKLLNDSLANEIVCVLRFGRYQVLAKRNHAAGFVDEVVTHSNQERGHVDQIAERIVQLGGIPDISPEGWLSCSDIQDQERTALVEMIKEDMIAECITIDSCRDIIGYIDDRDPASRRMMEEILAGEEKHAHKMAALLETLPA